MSDSLRTTSLPRCSSSVVDVGVEGHPHLAPPGEDVDRAVVVGAEEGAVGRRRLGQLLHLVAQVGHVLLGRLQREGQLLVLRDGLGQLALGLEQLLLQGLDPPRALLQTTPEDGDLLFGRLGPDPSAPPGRRRPSDPPLLGGRAPSPSKSTVGITSFGLHSLSGRPYTGTLAHSTHHCRRSGMPPPAGDLTDRQPTEARLPDSIEPEAPDPGRCPTVSAAPSTPA